MIQETFGHPKAFLPVIHPISKTAALTAVEVSISAGADGVWLINQGLDAEDTLALAAKVRILYPKLWVGVNLLGFSADETASLIQEKRPQPHGLWSDEAGPVSSGQLLYFGSCAFKYQKPVSMEEYQSVIQKALLNGVNVVTTSGPGTGKAASMEKLQAFREHLGTLPLALASGVTPDNVQTFLPYVDVFLVASGIETSFGVLDPIKTKTLADQIHA